MAVEFKDYYKILGVSKGATEDEIRKAFRKLARQHHPDVAKNKAAAEEKFKEINEAYEVLSDPEKRPKYDALGERWNRPGGFRPPPGWRSGGRQRAPGGTAGEFQFEFGGTGFSDFFEQFFGGAGRGGFGRGFRFDFEEEPGPGGPGGTGGARRGQDIHGDLLVSFQEALSGSIRSISLRRVNPATGQAELYRFRVKIPAGVREDQLIRVSGQGEAGEGGGPAGDLYLRVRFEKHPDFQNRGADLFYDLELAPWEAVLGTVVTIPTLRAPVSLRVPAGTRPGQQLRIRGQGLPAGDNQRGDLYAAVTVQLPARVDSKERELWEQLAKVSEFNPRKS